jgi:hypothetical protein
MYLKRLTSLQIVSRYTKHRPLTQFQSAIITPSIQAKTKMNREDILLLAQIQQGSKTLLDALKAEETIIIPASTRKEQIESVIDFEIWLEDRHRDYRKLRENALPLKLAGIREGMDGDDPDVVEVYNKFDEISKVLGKFQKMLRR